MSYGVIGQFHPSQLPNRLLALESDAGVTVAGGLVTAWKDVYPGGVTFNFAATHQPAYSATGGPNGTPGITFNGTTTQGTISATWTPSMSNGLSAYFVIQNTSSVVNLVPFEMNLTATGAPNDVGWYSDSPSTGMVYFTNDGAGASGFCATGAGVMNTTSHYLLNSGQDNLTNGEIVLNGVVELSVTTLKALSTVARPSTWIGHENGGLMWQGMITAIFLFNDNHTTAQRIAFERWANAKYDLGF